jgi:hypothetical protein
MNELWSYRSYWGPTRKTAMAAQSQYCCQLSWHSAERPARKLWGMTESDLDKLWNVVPVGEANAAAASKIWKRLDMYARSTVQHELSGMAEAGRIHRLSRCMPMGGEVRLYYRREIP